MRVFTQDQINEILDRHNRWLSNEPQGFPASFSFSDFTYSDFSFENLSFCDFNHSYFKGVVFSGSDLTKADFSDATIVDCDFRDTILSGTNFFNAKIYNTSFIFAKIDEFSSLNNYPMTCPSHGDFIGWKKLNNKIIKLLIPAEAKRVSGASRKCRAEFAKVLDIQNEDGTSADVSSITNEEITLFYPKVKPITYTIGEMVYPDSFDENRWNECSSGIHFFISRNEATAYK